MAQEMKALLWIVVIACGMPVFLHAQDSTGAPAIVYSDPAHKTFFNYETFMAQRGTGGQTPESWVRLTPLERAKMVREVEASLKVLHDQLLKKAPLTGDDALLFAAVWGPTELSAQPSGHDQPRQALPHAEAAMRVQSISKKVDEFQGHWGGMFDGGQRSDAGDISAVPAVSAASGSKSLPSLQMRTARISAPDDVPPVDSSATGHARRAVPFAFGAMLVASLYWTAKKYALKRNQGSAAPEFPGTENIQLDELGRPILPRGVPPPSLRGYATASSDEGCTDSDCACPPPVSTCPVNTQCTCPGPPVPPAPLPQCKCPPK